LKAEELFKEAVDDVKIGCYNKAVSALYFSLRMMAEDFLLRIRAPIPRRDDKLANVLDSLGVKNVALALRKLYELRVKADYRMESISKMEADVAVRVYGEAREALKEKLKGE